jgi:hypothetical protein
MKKDIFKKSTKNVRVPPKIIIKKTIDKNFFKVPVLPKLTTEQILEKRLIEYGDYPSTFYNTVLKKIQIQLKSKNFTIPIESLLPKLHKEHCIRCHQEYCDPDENGGCVVEHWNKEKLEPCSANWVGDDLVFEVPFNGCGCLIHGECRHDEHIDFDYISDGVVLLDKFDENSRYCHKGSHQNKLEFPSFSEVKHNLKYRIIDVLEEMWSDFPIERSDNWDDRDKEPHNGYYLDDSLDLDTDSKESVENLYKDFKEQFVKAFQIDKCDYCKRYKNF